MKTQLADEVGYGVLTQAEYEEVTSHERRRSRMRAARRRTGACGASASSHAAGDLAFRKHHLAQGQRQHPDDRSAIYRSRAGELARTREVLEAARRSVIGR